MCAELGVSRSGYYAWRGRCESEHDRQDGELTVLIRVLFATLRANPGVRRIRAELAALGRRVTHKRVHRLMRAAGLQGRHPRAWKRTTVPGDRPGAGAGPDRARLHRDRPEPALGRRRDLCQDLGRVGVRGHRDRPVFAATGRLGGR